MPSASPGPVASPDRRQKLKQYNTIGDAVNLIRDSSKIVVLCGAGISTAVGIPDFRSEHGRFRVLVFVFMTDISGLYKQLPARFSDPQQLFYRDTFEDEPLAFWKDVHPIVPKLRQGQILKQDGSGSRQAIEAVPRYSKVHSFFNLLQDKRKLHTIFTQNIDALELAADVEPEKIVACHGSWDTATCLSCDGKAKAEDYLPVVLEKRLPLCSCARPRPVDPRARQSSRVKKSSVVDMEKVTYLDTKNGQVVQQIRSGRKKRRAIESELADILSRDSDDDDKHDPPARQGLLKPDITFFGEEPNKQYGPRLDNIQDDIDLLIIIGTSLAAQPVSQLPLEIPPHVPQIWISNQTTTSAKARGLRVDIELIGDADTIITELCARAQWSNALANRLWKNHLGSTKQARDAKTRAMRTIAATADAEAKSEGKTKAEDSNIASLSVKSMSTQSNHSAADAPLKPETEAATAPSGMIAPSADAESSAVIGKEQHSQIGSRPSAAKQPPIQGLFANLPASSGSVVTPAPQTADVQSSTTVADILPSTSPPLPYRGSSKRPLSIGDTLTANADALRANENVSNQIATSVRPQESPARPVKAARTATTLSAVGKYDAVSDPDLRIFPDEAFPNIIYFKKKT